MLSGFITRDVKSSNAYLIACIVELCIIQSINQRWREVEGLILLGVYQCIAMHAHGIFEKELKSVFGILGFKPNMKSDLP